MADPLHSEFCPRCAAPVDTSGDECRYCDACGWFGDNTETTQTPPDTWRVRATQTLIETLTLYRKICRDELQAEQYCAKARNMAAENNSMQASLQRIQRETRNATQALVNLYITWQTPERQP